MAGMEPEAMPRLHDTREVRICGGGGYFPVLVSSGRETLAFVRTGAGHFGRAGRVSVCRSEDGAAWSAPEPAALGDTDVRNPCAGALDAHTLALAAIEYDYYHGAEGAPSPGHGETRLVLFESADRGRTWRRDARSGADAPPGSPYGRFVPFRNQLLMPYYRIDAADPVSCCLARSRATGAWEQAFEIATGFVEPAVVHAGGALVAAMRGWEDTVGDCGTWVSRSADGREWTPPRRVTSGSAHPADLTVLSGGALLMTVAERALNAQFIMAMVSADHGATWSAPARITDIFSNCDFGYPSTVEAAPGELLTAYYMQPGFDPENARASAARCCGDTAEARAVSWSLAELIGKSPPPAP